MRFEIAPMIPSDIPTVMEIERSSNLEPWSEQSFLDEMYRLHSRVFVAREFCGKEGGGEEPQPCADRLGQVVGYVCFWRVADEIQILNVAVHRDQSVGRLEPFVLPPLTGRDTAPGFQNSSSSC